MFAENRGDVVLPAKMDAEKVRTPLVMERGSIGLGTMNSQAEFKDVKVTQGEKVLYASDFAKGVTEWRSGRGGQWSVQDLSLIHISEPTRLGMISYAVFC